MSRHESVGASSALGPCYIHCDTCDTVDCGLDGHDKENAGVQGFACLQDSRGRLVPYGRSTAAGPGDKSNAAHGD
jgi:hypothetical protein